MEKELNLYNINQEMANVRDLIYESYNEETGEYDLELAKKFNKLKITKENKMRGCIAIKKKVENDVELIDKEIERLKKLKENRKKADEVLTYLLMLNTDVGKKYDLGTFLISWRKSTSVNVDGMEIPKTIEKIKGFYKVKTTYTPDKTRIKEALQKGEEVKGAYLEEKENMQIK